MKLKDTRIDMAGKFRCCSGLGSSKDKPDATEDKVNIGDKITCGGCNTTYELKDIGKRYPYWEV